MNNPSQQQWHQSRMNREARFRWYGRSALIFSVLMLAILLGSIASRGYLGFVQTQIKLPIVYDAKLLAPEEGQTIMDISASGYNRLVQAALRAEFPEVTDQTQLHRLYALVSLSAGGQLKHQLATAPDLLSHATDIWVPAASDVDQCIKNDLLCLKQSNDRLNDEQIIWLRQLDEKGQVHLAFNRNFFTHGDSRTPEQAGFLGAITGSLLTLAICLLASFPIGVMTAVYLEEFAHKGKFVDIIEVNINNLAAVPSIVFGLLGLAVYINMMHMPRSAPLVGGLTLALMILPVIIIATRASLEAVPPSVRDAARALGASPLQVVCHHALPLSMPGIMTGTILGMARAIGETAPLLMIGMVAFVVDTPTGFSSPSTVMPVQIYLWGSSPELGFAEKTAAGILVLLVLLLAMNALAIFLRKRFETRW